MNLFECRLDKMVQAFPYIPEGMAYRMGDVVYVRHMSEFYLGMSGARWHPWKGHCPTWDDAMECRCMLGGDA